jgi:hypothetical protein
MGRERKGRRERHRGQSADGAKIRKKGVAVVTEGSIVT